MFICRNCGGFAAIPRDVRSSPVTSILNSNYSIPTQKESQDIRCAIKVAQADLAVVQAEVHQAQTVLDDLQRKQRELEKYVIDHQTLLSPARLLPAEIYSEIFTHCLPEGFQKIGETEAPLLLGQVCSGWRAIALSTPHLWSSVFLEITEHNVGKFDDMITTWLDRSGRHPLSISITCRLNQDSHPVIDTVLQHSHHWHRLHFDISMQLFNRISRVKGAMPLLESLKIRAPFSSPSELSDIFEIAPRLLRAELPYPHSLRMMKLPWAQLQRVSACGSVDECLEVMRQASALVEASFRIDGRSSALLPSTPVRMASLECLHIQPFVDVASLFECLELPVLREIEVWPWSFPSVPWPQTSFQALLAASSRSIKKLTLKDVSLTDTELIQCLSQLPSLIELEIEEPIIGSLSISDHVLNVLTHRNGLTMSSRILPKLQVLRLTGHLSFNDQTLLDMIRSRRLLRDMRKMEGKLVLLELDFRRDVDSDMIAGLSTLRDEGLHTYVRANNKSLMWPWIA